MAKAKRAGFDDIIAGLQPKPSAAAEEIAPPPAEPTDDEIHGIDVLSIEDAVRVLWKEKIYAESAMGCTGPVVKLPAKYTEKAKEILKANGYL